MVRARLAVALAVLACLCLAATLVVAVATYRRDTTLQATRVVRDPGTGATFEVPRAGWRVRGVDRRISYGAVEVVGPAVFRTGYCSADPRGSFRAMAGFTAESLEAWVSAVLGSGDHLASRVHHERVTLTDGTAAMLRWQTVYTPGGECSAPGVEVAVLRARQVSVVVVADIGDHDTIGHLDVRRIAQTLELP